MFWEDLQEYHHLFYAETLSPFQLQKQSKVGQQTRPPPPPTKC